MRPVLSVKTGKTRKPIPRSPEAQQIGGIDFLFIDGDHSYDGLKGDWEAWRGLIRPGGVVALHDSHSTPTRDIEGAGSVAFTRDAIVHDPWFERVEVVDSLTVMRRRGNP